MRLFARRHLSAVTAIGIIVLLVALGAGTEDGRTIVSAVVHGDSKVLRSELLDLGFGGVLVLLAVILSHAIVPFPTELVSAAAGYVYGFWGAMPMLLAFWVASALLAYWLAERFGRPLARRVVGQRKLGQAERFVRRSGVVPLISVRLIPFVPYNAVCYAAGIVRVPVWRFAWTTFVGLIPLTALVTYLGSRLKQPNFGDWRIWVAVAAFVAVAVAAQVLDRRLRRSADAEGRRAG
jgi:uncharacterized membrane protein YdjX (TVP38/TMEM64 family)